MSRENTVRIPLWGECEALGEPGTRRRAGRTGRQAGDMQGGTYGRRNDTDVPMAHQHELYAQVLLRQMRQSPAEGVFPRTVDRRIASDLLAGKTFGLQPRQEGQSLRHPDGSVSFGGYFGFDANVGRLTRASAMDPHVRAVATLAHGRNRFVHNSAISALDMPGVHQGVLNPEDGDVMGKLGDIAHEFLQKHGVRLDRLLCDRLTASRIIGCEAAPGGHAGDSPVPHMHDIITLPGMGDIEMTILPGRSNILHMVEPFTRLLHTDGGAVFGYTPTTTGCNLALYGYQEFTAIDTGLGGVPSAATWTIPPPDTNCAECPEGVPPQRPGVLRRLGRAPWDGAPKIAMEAFSWLNRIQPHLPASAAAG